MSESNNNTPMRITQLEEATEYEDGMFYAVAKAGRGTYKIPVDEMTPNEQALSDKIENEIVPAVENSFAYGTVDESEIATFTDGSALPMPKLEVAIEPVQEGSGDPSPENIRPIIGWDEVNVTRCGKNICPQKITEFSFSKNAGGNSSVQGDTLVITTTSSLNSGVYSIFSFVESFTGKCSYSIDIKASTDGDVLLGMSNAGRKTVSVTTSWQRVKFEDVTFDGNSKTFVIYSQGVDNTIQVKDFMFELGSVAHDYEPYAGTTYTIDLDGTRYGGKLDVVNGIVTPAPYYASYNGEALTGEWISDRDKYEVGATPTIGAQVVNIGASDTPVSIAPTIIKSLQGDNNFFVDTGEIDSMQYWGR